MADGKQYDRELTDRVTLRRIAYGLLIIVAAAGMTGRIFAVKSKSGRTPMLSANDRSRWANIRALVDHGTYEIDQVSFRSPAQSVAQRSASLDHDAERRATMTGQRDPEWHSIDMVKHRGRDGREHYYSSKPTLFTSLMAIPYWIAKNAMGTSLAKHPFHVIRLLLILFNVVPLIVYFAVLAWMAERLGTTDFGRLFVLTFATFGTYLTTFAVTLNNHLPAAVCVAATTGVLLQIGWYGKQGVGWFALAGSLAAFTAANELPAMSFCCLVAVLLFWISPRQTLLAFLPAALLVFLAAVGTNYWAHDTWSTPYAHRRDGPLIATVSLQDELLGEPEGVSPGPGASQILSGRLELRVGKISEPLRSRLQAAGLAVSADATLAERPAGKGWVLWDPQQERRWALRVEGNSLRIHDWDNWYEYDGSYWSSGKKQGVDRGESSKLVYAFHVLLGHHGLFSLTPLWLASLAGAVIWLRRGSTTQQALALATLLLTAVCLAFYIFLRPLEDRNYGGVSCCLRWTLWLIPLWLLCLLPAADTLAESPWLRRIAALLLFISVLSAAYNSLNPWSHPWLFDYWTHLGWIRY